MFMLRASCVLLISPFVICLCGCEPLEIRPDAPPARPPADDRACPDCCPYESVELWEPARTHRQPNWGPSCVHASMVSALRQQGQFTLADWWRRNHYGGCSARSLLHYAKRAGLDYAYTFGDAAFLDWCHRTHRWAVVFYYKNHAVTFCGWDRNGAAILLDNNHIDRFRRVPRAEFLRRWQREFGGFACAPVYGVPSPLPWI